MQKKPGVDLWFDFFLNLKQLEKVHALSDTEYYLHVKSSNSKVIQI